MHKYCCACSGQQTTRRKGPTPLLAAPRRAPPPSLAPIAGPAPRNDRTRRLGQIIIRARGATGRKGRSRTRCSAISRVEIFGRGSPIILGVLGVYERRRPRDRYHSGRSSPKNRGKFGARTGPRGAPEENNICVLDSWRDLPWDVSFPNWARLPFGRQRLDLAEDSIDYGESASTRCSGTVPNIS
jgi:hypothetical protein